MRLHVHFGIHRTGTTSIHKALSGSVKILDSHGMLYPDLGVQYRHVNLAWKLKSGKISYNDLISRIKYESSELTKQVILSSEDFCLVDIEEWLHSLSEHFDVTTSIYLKRQDIWLESWYNQHIKWPWSKKFSSATPEFFIKNINDFYWIDYWNTLERISSVIPREKMYVKIAGKDGVTNTVEDFLNYLEIDADLLNPYKDSNESLSSARIDILRRIDIYSLGVEARKKILSALKRIDIAEDNGGKRVFNNTQRDHILGLFSDSNKMVAKKYFNSDSLFKNFDSKDDAEDLNFVSDHRAYRIYIPEILKLVCQPEKK